MGRGFSATRVWLDEVPLFTVELYQPRRADQTCDRCLTVQHASDDGLRVAGWLVFDGRSETGQELHVRICPPCQKEKK